MIKFLINHFPELVDEHRAAGLHISCQHGHIEVMRLLFDSETDFGDLLADGRTLMHVAAYGGHLDIVEMLSQLKPELSDIVDSRGRNALCSAIESSQIKVAEHLVRSRPDLLHCVSEDDYTVLHILSSTEGSSNMAKLLLKAKPALIELLTNERDCFGCCY